MTNEGRTGLDLAVSLSKTFTPSTPVSTVDLFQGRFEQILEVLSAFNEPGLQIVLYGERGVGKTSLANLLPVFAVPDDDSGSTTPPIGTRVNCTTSDTFASIWRKVFRGLKIEVPESWSYATPDPDDIRVALSELKGRGMIVLDEFDRWEDDEGLSLMADTLKALSDHNVPSRVVIVGVADSIDNLIGEHESIQRAIAQVPMPRMSRDELLDIPRSGFKALGMSATPESLNLIASLSEGLPHYAHWLSLHAGRHAVGRDSLELELEDVLYAIKVATEKHTVLSEYQKAVHAQRSGTLHEKVLLACALVKKDRLGYFTAADVQIPMSSIMGKSYSSPAFSNHLKAFTEPERGPALRREGPERKYRYRFRNPLIQPFVIINALEQGWLPVDYRNGLIPGSAGSTIANKL